MDATMQSELKTELKHSLNLPESESKRYTLGKLRDKAVRLYKSTKDRVDKSFLDSVAASCEAEMQWHPETGPVRDFMELGTLNMKCAYLSDRRLDFYRQFKNLVECKFNSVAEMDMVPISDAIGKFLLNYVPFDDSGASVSTDINTFTGLCDANLSLQLSPPYSEINDETIIKLKQAEEWALMCDDVPPSDKLELLKLHFPQIKLFWMYGTDFQCNIIVISASPFNLPLPTEHNPGGVYDVTHRLTPDAKIVCPNCSSPVHFNCGYIPVAKATNAIHCPQCMKPLIEPMATNNHI